MESPQSAARALEELRRAELVTHTRYPRLGWWYPPTAGAVGACYVCCWALPGMARAAGFIAYAVVVGLGAGAYIRLRGVNPRLRSAPPALQREMRWFGASLAAIVLVATALFFSVGWQAAAAATFVAITALVARYEQRYAAAAHQAELDSGLFEAR